MSLPSRTNRGVGPHADEHVDVAGAAPEDAGVSLAGQPDPLPVVDSGRDVDLERPLLDRPAGASAFAARVLDHASAPAARRAGGGPDELAEDAARDLLEATAATAAGARRRSRPRLDAFAAAAPARDRHLDGHLHLDAARGLGELDGHLGGDVGTARSPASAPTGAAEQVLAEERREEVAEVSEVEVRRREPPGAEAGVTEAVVQLARLGVREDLVGLGHLAKALLRLGLFRHVRVKLSREAPERLLDVLLLRVARDAEHLVVVPLSRRHGSHGARGRVLVRAGAPAAPMQRQPVSPRRRRPRRTATARGPPTGRSEAPSRSPSAAGRGC